EIVVVDNGSVDGSCEVIKGLKDVVVVELESNCGFAKACNIGAGNCKSPYVLFLNPDTKIYENCFNEIFRYLKNECSEDIAVIGVKIKDDNQQVQRRCAYFPTWRTYVGMVTGLNYIIPKIFPNHFMSDFDHLQSRSVDQVIGAFFLVNNEVYKRLGGFDEKFFVYYEEVDFCYRAKKQNYRTWYLSSASIYHKGGGLSEKVKAERLFYSLRSRLIYAKKHFSGIGYSITVFVTMIIEPIIRVMYSLIRNNPRDVCDIAKGYYMLYVARSR
ncbi:glycosyltransferase family 2 protein, partial [bacterium]|nr:glycosyltransferase family 2 protein [bacterium]